MYWHYFSFVCTVLFRVFSPSFSLFLPSTRKGEVCVTTSAAAGRPNTLRGQSFLPISVCIRSHTPMNGYCHCD